MPENQVGREFKGSRDGTVVRALTSHQCGPVSIPIVDSICGLSLVVFALNILDFLPQQKSTFPNSSSTWKQWTNSHSVDVPLKFPFIYFFLFINVYLASVKTDSNQSGRELNAD